MSIRRLTALILALLLAAPALAVSLADRSPFTQGHWWTPSRSGSGFDIFNSAGTAMVVWYTYDEQGTPVWYTASGAPSSIGTPWDLLRHRWTAGRKGEYTVVGSLRLTVVHPEALSVDWQIGSRQGTLAIQPFTLSGVINETDYSGHFFDPLNSGWGVTVTEQGNAFGAALYTYDAAGEPTWVSGYHRGGRNVELFACNGACPWCEYRPTVTKSAGRLSFEFQSEMRATVRNQLTIPMAAGVNVDGATIAALSRPASWRAADRQLASFSSPTALKTYLDAGIQNVPTSIAAGVGFSAAPPGVAFSTTNLQELGVDEADLVKSDGRFIYTYAHDSYSGNRLPTLRIAEIGSEGALLTVRGTVDLASGSATSTANAGLYLDGDKLASVAAGQPVSYGGWAWMPSSAWTKGTTNVEILSTAMPERPATLWRAEIDGYLVASRRIGQRVYLVSRFVPFLQGFSYGSIYPPAITTNQQILANTALADMLPKVRINGGATIPLVSPSDVYLPPQGARKPFADMIVVTAIDLAAPKVAQALVIMGSADAVYASTASLYVAGVRSDRFTITGPILPGPYDPLPMTDIHRISLGGTAMEIIGSGTIEGFLGNDPDKTPFRLSEHQGRLRAVTSTQSFIWGVSASNRLTILEPSTTAPGLLKTVSYLPNALRPELLGKPNEFLYGTRFVGDRLYAVTFKKIDPLYIVDLSNPADPRIAGELVVPGFSDYLHPLPGGLLLGFGKDAKPSGVMGDGQFAWYQGLQLTLFDVTNAAQPREIQRVLMGKRGSESALLRHHHAFSELVQADGARSIAIPARIHDGSVPQGSPDWTMYPWMESGLMRFEVQGATASDARLVQRASLITHRVGMTSQPSYDAAANGARSVLFPKGTIYVTNGQFWQQDMQGTSSGPR